MLAMVGAAGAAGGVYASMNSIPAPMPGGTTVCTMPAGVCTRIVCPATAPGGTTTFTSVGMAGATVAVAVCAATGAIDSRNASTSYSILVTAKFDMGLCLLRTNKQVET